MKLLREEGTLLRKFHVISADKKLTHDLMELAGYNHLVPGQACYPRQYDGHLAERIETDLELEEGDKAPQIGAGHCVALPRRWF